MNDSGIEGHHHVWTPVSAHMMWYADTSASEFPDECSYLVSCRCWCGQTAEVWMTQEQWRKASEQ